MEEMDMSKNDMSEMSGMSNSDMTTTQTGGKKKKVVGQGKATYSKIVGYAVTVEPYEIIHEIQNWEVLGKKPDIMEPSNICIYSSVVCNWAMTFLTTYFDTGLAEK